MIDRHAWLGVLAAALASVPREIVAQAPVRRIGLLVPGTVPDPARYPEPLLQGLRDLGWFEGENLLIERRVADDRTERLPAMAEDLVARGVELIVTVGTPAALAARRASASVPIVMATIGDPVAAGLAQSLARPGGNSTGNTFLEPDLGTKRLQLLKELLPLAKRVGVLVNPLNPALQMLRAGEAEALRALGLQPVFVEVSNAAEVQSAFNELRRQGVHAVVVHADSLFVSNRAHIAALARVARLPTMAEGRAFVEAGALLSYAPSSQAMVRRAAVFVDKILKGSRPGDLPIERPNRFELVIHKGTAHALGLSIPQSLLLRADEVIQ